MVDDREHFVNQIPISVELPWPTSQIAQRGDVEGVVALPPATVQIVEQQTAVPIREDAVDADVDAGIAHHQHVAPGHQEHVQLRKVQLLHKVDHKSLRWEMDYIQYSMLIMLDQKKLTIYSKKFNEEKCQREIDGKKG